MKANLSDVLRFLKENKQPRFEEYETTIIDFFETFNTLFDILTLEV